MTSFNIKNIVLGLSSVLLHSMAQGQVVYSFAETTSGDVVATLSGSFDTSSLTFFQDGLNAMDSTPNFIAGSNTQLFVSDEVNNDYDVYELGSSFGSGLTANPDSHTLAFSFGYSGEYLVIGGGVANNAILNPTGAKFGTMTWNGVSLNDIGLGSLTTSPKVVYQNNGTISFVTVPEPSSSLLLLIGGVLSTIKRSRKI